jgi:hypothetical protein
MTKGKTMSTMKRARKGEVVRSKAERNPKMQVLKLSPEVVLDGLKRFGTVCDYVESQMRKDREPAGVGQALDTITSQPKPIPSVEEMAIEMRSLAQDVAVQAEAIRIRMTNGGNSEAAGNAPTQGPIKDCVDSTTHYLFSIRRDLEMINQYVNG